MLKEILEDVQNESWWTKFKNKFKNLGTEDMKPGHTCFEWNKDEDSFPVALWTIKTSSKENDLIEYTIEDREGNITNHSMEYKDWFKSDITNSDWLGEEEGSGERAFRMMLLNRKKHLTITLAKGSTIEGIGDNEIEEIRTKKEIILYVPINRNLGEIHNIYAYKSATFDSFSKFDINPFDVINYK
jgi:hypothetical protein